MQLIRRLVQLAFFLVPMVLTYRFVTRASMATLETYCPFGALETMPFYLLNSTFLCAVSGINLWMLIGVTIGTVLVGRAFCSWVCPVGTLVAIIAWVGTKATGFAQTAWHGRAGSLWPLRFVVLAAVLVATHKYGDLVFRPFCPYFVAFSWHGHGVESYSYLVVPLVFIAGVLLPYFWCRVLCPFGAFLGVVRKLSPIAPTLTPSCTGCRACERACPQQLEITAQRRVSDMDCTHCLACIDACPCAGIELRAGYDRPRPNGG